MLARKILFFVVTILLFCSHPAGASETKGVAIIKDQKAKSVRIVIDGKEVAVIDRGGLQVNGDIACSSVILKPNRAVDARAKDGSDAP